MAMVRPVVFDPNQNQDPCRGGRRGGVREAWGSRVEMVDGQTSGVEEGKEEAGRDTNEDVA